MRGYKSQIDLVSTSSPAPAPQRNRNMCLTYYSVLYACAHAWIDPGLPVKLCEAQNLHLQQNLPEVECPNAWYWQKYKIHGKCPECCDREVNREKGEVDRKEGERRSGGKEEGGSRE
jgi:hypothetical protein